MATMVQEIIDQARDFHAQFNVQSIPDMPALKALERLQSQFLQAVIAESPDALSQWFVVNGLPADWETGIALPEHLLVLGGDCHLAANGGLLDERTWEVTMVSPGHSLTHPEYWPTAYVMDGRLFLTDVRKWYGTEHGWEDLLVLRVRYVPTPDPLAKLESLLSLPDSAEPALVANLALWMADRVGVNLPTLREQANSSGAGWLSYMINSGSGRTWMMEVVE